MTDPLGPVTITPRDIYDQLVQLRSAVERLIDAEADTGKKLDDHEARIRGLERGRWPLPSLALLVSILALVLPVVLLIKK
ncbi:hypothetical protein GCM10010124_26290 [Pilimelia terevasa]|uniref:Uncharacterized protein n=1 Tax=Pilimelia terevasa TaxID=53372 RepID=A0A8J3FJ53_9ACTN|nr:hypothetical protein [Pilimelia terevasa]GGK32255.1 hypothetical protein GCM10010124_26290 [Pilimelia terevasa]